MSVMPYYNKPIAGGACWLTSRPSPPRQGFPLSCTTIPARTMREISDETLLRLSESSQFMGLNESTGSVPRLFRLRSILPEGFRLLCGNDANAMPYPRLWRRRLRFDGREPVSRSLPPQLRLLPDWQRAGFTQCIQPPCRTRHPIGGRLAGRGVKIRYEPFGFHASRRQITAGRTGSSRQGSDYIDRYGCRRKQPDRQVEPVRQNGRIFDRQCSIGVKWSSSLRSQS